MQKLEVHYRLPKSDDDLHAVEGEIHLELANKPNDKIDGIESEIKNRVESHEKVTKNNYLYIIFISNSSKLEALSYIGKYFLTFISLKRQKS